VSSGVLLPFDRAVFVRRLPQLLLGYAAIGTGFAFMVEADLGLGPWEVLHQGISDRSGIPMGMVTILVGIAVLGAWVPLRQRPGIGTIGNVLLVGVALDAALLAIPPVGDPLTRWMLLVSGTILAGFGIGTYLGTHQGPGPRDGLMTGMAARGWGSIRAARTAVEAAVLVAGWLLGGTVGVGTVLFAVSIGPLIQLCLARMGRPAGAHGQRSHLGPRIR
jgi:uncharacterized membrane protein YczE